MNTKPALFAIILLIFQPGFASASDWVAGFGMEVLVTTDDLSADDPVYLAGYGLGNRPAETIHDDVSVRSLYLSDGTQKILFVSLDTIGFSQDFAEQARIAVTKSTGIKTENIILSATHTHSSIDIQGIWGSVTESQQKKLLNKVVGSAKEAFTHQQPVTLKLSRSMKGEGLNRRHKSEGIISQITAVHIETPDNKPVVLLLSFGSHPVVLDKDNLQVTSDWVGFARNKLETDLQTRVLFINGVLGDVIPLPEHKKRNFENAQLYGDQIASHVIAAKQENITELKSKLSYCTEQLKVDAENLQLVGLTKTLGQGTISWPSTFSTQVTSRVSVIVLGSLVLITVPGEPVTAFGRELMEKVQNRPVAVLGLSHDSLGYLIPENDFGLENATEEPFSLSSKFATQTSTAIDRLIDQCLGLVLN
ncbi:hypothetical protein EOPP23_00980 [Endozoicomonas sp. OPT23]|uniref:hypothetical protein n=1 Tax=Endozoicomonas sp. OPT23 TaxID=2072845 RepID=UPI00129B61C6|nr:hypothetical protein [Endozoicomonas sp. OPT23]MRI31565.1 hypothetical protein [Endozoicomonas sp. OPT23]